MFKITAFIFSIFMGIIYADEVKYYTPEKGEIECKSCKNEFQNDEGISFALKNRSSNKHLSGIIGIMVKINNRWFVIRENLAPEEKGVFVIKPLNSIEVEWKNNITDLPSPEELRRKGEIISNDSGFMSYDLEKGGIFALVIFKGNIRNFEIIHEFKILQKKFQK